ncbi:MAG: pilus assembly protein [Dehalococcoidales bacterium]|nr:pilus assembly protein [Dehalococcoidales bacterium]
MRGLARPFERGQRGQAVVEFALVFGIFAFLLMGIFDFGRGVAAYNAISNAAREGARLAIHNPAEFNAGTDANIRAEVINRTAMLAGLGPGDIDITPAQAARTYGDVVTVRVSYRFAPVTPVISAFLPGGAVDLSASAKAVVR